MGESAEKNTAEAERRSAGCKFLRRGAGRAFANRLLASLRPASGGQSQVERDSRPNARLALGAPAADSPRAHSSSRVASRRARAPGPRSRSFHPPTGDARRHAAPPPRPRVVSARRRATAGASASRARCPPARPPPESPADLYALLGVPEDATETELKRAYRTAAKDSHPDVNPDADPGAFARVSEAYEVLSDPSKRRLYDEARRWDASEATRRGGGGGGGDDAGGFSQDDFWDAWRKARASTSRGDFSEETLRRDARDRRDAFERREEAAAYWAHEKRRSARDATRVRAAVARAAGNRADRAAEVLRGAWVTRRGAHWADAAMVLVCGAFVAGAAGAYGVGARPPREREKG